LRRLAVVMSLLMPAISQAWWNDEWNFRKEISFDLTSAGAAITGTVQDVPVLIRLHGGNFGYFNDTKPDASDFRFVDGDDKTPLKYHIERFDAVNQLAFVWVRVPRVAGASNGQKIYLYYGNAKAPANGDAAGTYDKNQALVLQFSNAQPVDATAYGNQPSASSAEVTSASLIAGGVKFNGSESIKIPSSASLRLVPSSGATMSAWVRQDAPGGDDYVMALQDQGTELVLGVRGARPYARLIGGAARGEALAGADMSAAAWHHLAATYAGGKLILYVDGAVSGSANALATEIAGQLTIGGGRDADHGFTGEMDEVQFSNVARSADWLTAAARSQGLQAPLVAYGGDAQRETQKVSYFKVTLQNVTADGWAVIGLLVVMFVVAVFVMVGKALYLRQVFRGNRKFLRDFDKLKGDPTTLDRDEADDGDEALEGSPFMPHIESGSDQYPMSTIYRLYHHGVQEINGRVSAKSAGARAVSALSPQAIEAIRATMDASMVRMTQKLASSMVLLTIAIAGGPFLGLLGTVVGVMITFAAIAASGDVNVNSIAPGIAAALVATVAGLGVAIPSLFGYNWLNTRIREINADMRVFVDEFVSRVAERYVD